MVRVSFVQSDVYVVILEKLEREQLDNRANQDKAGSSYLARIIQMGLDLGRRIEDSHNAVESSDK